MKKIINKGNLNAKNIISDNNMTLKKFMKEDFKEYIKMNLFYASISTMILLLCVMISILLIPASVSISAPLLLVLFLLSWPLIGASILSVVDIVVESILIPIERKRNKKNVFKLLKTLKGNGIDLKHNDISNSKIETVQDISFKNDRREFAPRRKVTSIIKLGKKDKLRLIKQITTTYNKKTTVSELYVMNKEDVKSLPKEVIKKLVYKN